MEALALHIGAPKLNWEDNTIFISVVEAKLVTPRVKHIDITVFLLQKQFVNCIFVPKYEKSIVIPAYMCTNTCRGTIISRSTKWTTGFIFYPNSDTEHYQLIILYDFVVN